VGHGLYGNIPFGFRSYFLGASCNSSIHSDVRNFPCQPFKFNDIKASAFFEVEQLGYTYAESQTVVTRSRALEAMNLQLAAAPSLESASPPAPPQTLDVQLDPIANDFQRAYLRLYDVEHTEKTYEFRVFANQDVTPDATTALTNEQRFLGSFFLLGHGNCPGAPGHCDRLASTADGLRQEHHLSPGIALIDVTNELKSLQGKSAATDRSVGEGPLSFSLVVVDLLNHQVSHEHIRFTRLSLSTV